MTGTASLDADIEILKAVAFAAEKHRHQRRKDSLASPYVNHPIEVALHLAEIGGVRDRKALLVAVLHDILEDTDTGPDELEERFGAEVCRLVASLSDDRRLDQAARKAAEIAHAPELLQRAKLVKIADKTCNLPGLSTSEPAGWSRQRKLDYIDFARNVIDGCRGASPVLEAHFDDVAKECERQVQEAPHTPAHSGLLEKAIGIAAAAHQGQLDQGGSPYILHPLRVMAAVAVHGEHAMVAAVLHDVLEDSPLDAAWLRKRGIPKEVVEVVEICTRQQVDGGAEPYEAFIERIAGSGSPLAIAVKCADLADNLQPERLGRALGEKDVARMEKYQRARARLEPRLES